MLAYLAVAAVFYFSYGLFNSVGNRGGWIEYNDGDFFDEDYTEEKYSKEDLIFPRGMPSHMVVVRSPLSKVWTNNK